MGKMVAVDELVVGNMLADAVNSIAGKVLLGKDIILTARHISLLRTWDIENVFITADEEENNEAFQEPPSKTNATEHFPFHQEYSSILRSTVQSFDVIRKTKFIPIPHLKNTAVNIYSAINTNNFDIMNFLLSNDCKLSNFIPRHSVMVAYFSGIIARQMKWNEKDIAGIAFASLLHDVGNLVTDKIVDSRKKVHIAETAGLLQQVKGLPREVVLGVVQHRECMNSTGFPMGAKGSQIHPYAKIIAIADVFHNLAYTDEYANPFPILDMLTREMYGKFDTDLCQSFVFRVRDSLLFNKVLLSSGQEAEIIFFNPNSYSTPVVKTIDNQIIDLSQIKDLSIKQLMKLA